MALFCTRAYSGKGVALMGALILVLMGCARQDNRSLPAGPLVNRINSPPEWRPGDRWIYEWTSGSDSGTKAVEVLEIKEVNEVQYYVVRIGDVDHYFTLDLHWAGSVMDSRVEARMLPPQPWFLWPLEVGRRWVHRGAYEERGQKKQHHDAFAVVSAETVEVPGGRFYVISVAREADDRDFDRYWYAPEVRWYVRWIGRRGEVQFEERLREYHPAPRPIPESAPVPPPSGTR